ncbi:MAG TPA: chemotaxis protein CheW [Pararobbsia sp.]|nr:chemotaxis protein CheW [Pararobbsia sp.]
MLFLTFELGTDRYALDTSDIVEVVARAPLKAIPSTPSWVAGLCDYRGHTVPVIDLTALALGHAASDRISTRIVIVRYIGTHTSTGPALSASATRAHPLLGLIVEHANRTLRLEPDDFEPSGVDTPDARWLGRVARDADGLVQWVHIAHLLPPDVHAMLFTEAHA